MDIIPRPNPITYTLGQKTQGLMQVNRTIGMCGVGLERSTHYPSGTFLCGRSYLGDDLLPGLVVEIGQTARSLVATAPIGKTMIQNHPKRFGGSCALPGDPEGLNQRKRNIVLGPSPSKQPAKEKE
jgi:hypothetical protein